MMESDQHELSMVKTIARTVVQINGGQNSHYKRSFPTLRRYINLPIYVHFSTQWPNLLSPRRPLRWRDVVVAYLTIFETHSRMTSQLPPMMSQQNYMKFKPVRSRHRRTSPRGSYYDELGESTTVARGSHNIGVAQPGTMALWLARSKAFIAIAS